MTSDVHRPSCHEPTEALGRPRRSRHTIERLTPALLAATRELAPRGRHAEVLWALAHAPYPGDAGPGDTELAPTRRASASAPSRVERDEALRWAWLGVRATAAAAAVAISLTRRCR